MLYVVPIPLVIGFQAIKIKFIKNPNEPERKRKKIDKLANFWTV